MDFAYRPYNDPEFEVLIERIHPPRVCIDNDTYPDCTLVKVDSANKQGMLLEMVQVLTDLDLLISKSYVSSDGGWLMDVFHVTDQRGHKVTDESLIHYIQEGISAIRKASKVEPTHPEARPRHVLTGHMAIEMTGIDRPGMLSEMTAVLTELRCHVSAAAAWTHNRRVACILYIKDTSAPKDQRRHPPTMDPCRAAEVQAHLENVAEAHHYGDERWSIRLAGPTAGQTHTERRLHQLMAADCDYEECCSCCDGGCVDDDDDGGYPRCHKGLRKGCDGTHVRIGYCREKEYSVITVRSRDRPKLLFDTVCAMTDLDCVVYHASISSSGSSAFQEYYVKHKDGRTLDTEEEKRKVVQCLIAAIERRASHGLRLDICTPDRDGLLSEITRVFRENGLSIARVEIGTRGDKAVGTFYVKDTSGQVVNGETLKKVRQEIGGIKVVEDEALRSTLRTFTGSDSSSGNNEERPRFSLGTLLWSHIERLSGNFRPIKS